MIDVHFGAGNIGRGFIGEVLFNNKFEMVFIDVNEKIINELNTRDEYTIEFASDDKSESKVNNFSGINNKDNPEEVANTIAKANLVTTAIGPNILKFIAPLIAQGIQLRKEQGNNERLDVVACENMINGSQTLKEYVYQDFSDEDKKYADKMIGFPNAAVDRIVPAQNNGDDVLKVKVEPFKEWVIDQSQQKNTDIKLSGVEYVDDLEPYIERKLFSVNTGHASVAYNGFIKGYKTIIEAIQDEEILHILENVLAETGSLLIDKWNFDKNDLRKYQNTIINRFQNKSISDDIVRVARTPIRKLGFDERFIRPIRELKERGLENKALIQTAAKVLKFNYSEDDQSVELQAMLKEKSVRDVVKEVTSLTDIEIIDEIATEYNKL